jgi:hypothetical protein
MLVQAPGGRYISLFPAWDRTQDASFTNLLTKGAVEVSASWSTARQEAYNISVRARLEHKGALRIAGLDCKEPAATLAVKCADGSAPQPHTTVDGVVSFVAPASVRCVLVCGNGSNSFAGGVGLAATGR